MNHHPRDHNSLPGHGHTKFPSPLSGLLATLLLLSVHAFASTLPSWSEVSKVDLFNSRLSFSDVAPRAMSAVYTIGGVVGSTLPPASDIPVEPRDLVLSESLAGLTKATNETAAALGTAGQVTIERNQEALEELKTRSGKKLLKVGESTGAALAALEQETRQAGLEAGSLAAAVVSSTVEQIAVPTQSWWRRLLESISLFASLGREALYSIDNLISDYWSMALSNWQRFLKGEEPASVVASQPAVRPISASALERTKDEIREQVEAAIRKDLEQSLARIGTVQPAGGPGGTLTVFPSTGSSTLDSSITTQVKNSFSDEVAVRFDETGRSGVITPQFRSSTGSNYLFILTPLRK